MDVFRAMDILKRQNPAKIFNKVWIFAALIHTITASSSGVDLTMEPNATGCEVAKATVRLINDYYKAGGSLLKYDHNFLLYRIAYLYDYGQNGSLLPENGTGMWGMTMQHFDAARSWATTALNRVVDPDGFHSLPDEDLFKPRIGALTAFFLIQKHGTVPAQSQTEEQWDYWVEMTGLNDDDGAMRARFLDKSQKLLNGSDQEVAECMKCSQPPSDIIFIFDDSGSIGSDGFKIQVKFIRSVITYLKNSFDSGNTQSAIVVFATNLTSTTPYMQDYSSITAYIDKMSHKSGNTNLVAGLREARRIVLVDPNSRENDRSVRKLVFFLTDGAGNQEHHLYPSMTAQLKNVTDGLVVYSIGMTSGAIYDQLLLAATSEDYVRQYSDFNQFNNEIPAILYDTCEISVDPINAEVADIFEMLNLQLGEARVVQITYPMTDTVLLLDFKPAAKLKGNAELVVYVKCDGSNPSTVFHDYTQKITFEKDGTAPVQLATGFCKKISPTNGGKLRRSADGGSNATLDSGIITLSVEFLSTTDNCSICTIDLVLNMSTVDADTWFEQFVDIVEETGSKWLWLLATIFGIVFFMVLSFIAGYVCLQKWIQFKETNRQIDIYDERTMKEMEKYDGITPLPMYDFTPSYAMGWGANKRHISGSDWVHANAFN
ncbi:uncharacterized protein LOC134844773 [Symsagittifera roscoffensis]|uniref:uncharacterized protein LOC134844773 n=1 Tax=Symsagittifera roscoffensis TaxID=84072 RepID=UPI00307B67B9